MASLSPVSGAGSSPQKKLTGADLKKLSQRLCTDSMAQKEARLRQLREKFLASEGTASKKKLTAEEAAANVDRLYVQSMAHKDVTQQKLDQKYLGPVLATNRRLTKEELEASVEKLYSFSVTQKKTSLEKLEQKYLSDPPMAKLEEDQMTESVSRLYTQHKQNHATMMEQLKKKYLFQHPDAGKPKLPPARLTALAGRLHDAQIADKDPNIPWPVVLSSPTRKKLEDRYVANSLPTFPARSEAQWAETVSRLSSKE
eukprot:RCo020512